MAEIMAHAGHLGPEATNCCAPDTGNMGTRSKFHSEALLRNLYRGFGTLWFSGATKELAATSSGRKNSIGICDDGEEW